MKNLSLTALVFTLTSSFFFIGWFFGIASIKPSSIFSSTTSTKFVYNDNNYKEVVVDLGDIGRGFTIFMEIDRVSIETCFVFYEDIDPCYYVILDDKDLGLTNVFKANTRAEALIKAQDYWDKNKEKLLEIKKLKSQIE